MASGGLLIVLLVMAVGFDLYSQQIPNWLIGAGVALSFGLAILSQDPQLTFLSAFSGLAVGIVLFLPLFLIGKMGAGDIKLLGMAGSYIGPLAICWGALFSLIAGGVLATFWFSFNGQWWGVSINRNKEDSALKESGSSKLLRNTPVTGVPLASHPRRMPYAAAIAVGCTLAYLGFRH